MRSASRKGIMSSKQLNLVNGLMATMEVRQPAAWDLSPPSGSGSNYTVQRLMKTCEGNYGSWHFKKTTLDDLFGNSFKATVKTWKSPKNIFLRAGAISDTPHVATVQMECCGELNHIQEMKTQMLTWVRCSGAAVSYVVEQSAMHLRIAVAERHWAVTHRVH